MKNFGRSGSSRRGAIGSGARVLLFAGLGGIILAAAPDETLRAQGVGSHPSAGSAQPAASPGFELSCASCHNARAGEDNGFGPNLYGIFGKASGTASNFVYSPALAGGKIQWTEAALDRYLESPNQFAPGTSMPFGGLGSKSDRAEIIAYLKSAVRVAGK